MLCKLSCPPAKRLQKQRCLAKGTWNGLSPIYAEWQGEKCSLCWGTGDNLLYPSLDREIGVLVLRAVGRAKLLLKPIGTGVRSLCKTGPRTLKQGLGEILFLWEFVTLG